ncbi:MAG: glutamate--cysteine ligase [Proteobacteria bacterium]|nr:glutamate--cysteine ligase [Pseudomonadota bacterium]
MTGLHWFQGYGVELEYMVVNRQTLSVLPVTDRILEAVAGEIVNEVEVGPLRWSNELVLHVVELKTNGPAPTLTGLAPLFVEHVRKVNAILEPMGGRLMPSGMHPWMDPVRESRLWPHENSPIYDAYNRIFGCQGHGWSNLQSLHLNLPFCGDREFGRLHGAVRLVLPLLPALAASSPLLEGRVTGFLDTRLEVYRHNQEKIPSLAAQVIPEPVFTRSAYEEEILGRLYRDVAPHDPAGVLQEEWVNSRGAIARFERDTIEIRVIDVQETPAADLAIASATVAVLQALTAERWASAEEQMAWETEPLAALFLDCLRRGEEAVIRDGAYLSALGFPEATATAGEVWRHLAAELLPRGAMEPVVEGALGVILDRGPLARRLLRVLGQTPTRQRLGEVYGTLCECLEAGSPFLA